MYTLQVRFPEVLRPRLQQVAKITERSLNWLVVAAVTQYLAQLPLPATPPTLPPENTDERQPGA